MRLGRAMVHEPGLSGAETGFYVARHDAILPQMSIDAVIGLIAGIVLGIAGTLGLQRTVARIGWRTLRLAAVLIVIVAVIVLAIVFVVIQA